MVTYEWVVEEMDPNDLEEIININAFDSIIEARKFAKDCPTGVICLRRVEGNPIDGITDWHYAYAGDERFQAGPSIPQRLMKDFLSLS